MDRQEEMKKEMEPLNDDKLDQVAGGTGTGPDKPTMTHPIGRGFPCPECGEIIYSFDDHLCKAAPL